MSTVDPSSSSHRLPTLSAAAALQQQQQRDSERTSSLSTGIHSLDGALSGIRRGKVVEIWGPSGAGKTAVALQTARNATEGGEDVIWVACASTERNMARWEGKSRVRSLRAATLAHLLALVLKPPTWFGAREPALLVIDDLASLVDVDYPRRGFGGSSGQSEAHRWRAGRRYAVLGVLVTALNRLAILHNMAVLVTTGCSSRTRHDDSLPAAVAPAVGGPEWEAGIWSRVVVFRDFAGRFVGVQKCHGRNATPRDPIGDVGRVARFEIAEDGSLAEHVVDSAEGDASCDPTKSSSSPVKVVRKRKYDEIADSEDEEDMDEYGWAEKDEEALRDGDMTDEHVQAQASNGASETEPP